MNKYLLQGLKQIYIFLTALGFSEIVGVISYLIASVRIDPYSCGGELCGLEALSYGPKACSISLVISFIIFELIYIRSRKDAKLSRVLFFLSIGFALIAVMTFALLIPILIYVVTINKSL